MLGFLSFIGRSGCMRRQNSWIWIAQFHVILVNIHWIYASHYLFNRKKKLPTTICDNDGNLLGLIYAIWCSDLGLKVTYFLEFHIWNFYERISGISKQQIWRIFLKHKRIKPRSINGYGEKELRDAQKILVHGHLGSWIYTTYNYNVSRLWLVV